MDDLDRDCEEREIVLIQKQQELDAKEDEQRQRAAAQREQ